MNPPPARRLITFQPRDRLDRVFAVSLAIKGLDGVIELLGGLFLVLISAGQLERITSLIAKTLLDEALPEVVSGWATSAVDRITASGLAFGAAYLLTHGIVKVVLVVAVLRGKLWAYPWMMIVLAGFVAFQSFELAASHSPGLAVLTIFDLVVITLTWREFRRQRRLRSSRHAVDEPTRIQHRFSSGSAPHPDHDIPTGLSRSGRT